MNNGESKRAKSIVERYGGNRDCLIQILQDVQAEDHHYLSQEAVETVAKEMGLPLVQVYGVATFFKAFNLEPRGEHSVCICLGTACHVRGATAVLDQARRQLGIEPGGTTEDLKFSLDTVNCVGACALGPIAIVDGKYHGQMSSGKLKKVLKK